MILSPEGIEDKIGLRRVRARLREHAASDAGKRAVERLRPVSERGEAERRLRISAELQACLEGGEAIPFRATPELASVLRAARPEGAALPADLILAVLDSLETARLVRRFFDARKTSFPDVVGRWGRLAEDRELEDNISRVFDADGAVRDNASGELKRIRRELNSTRQALRTRMTSLLARAVSDGYAADEQPTIRSGRMVLPVAAGSRRRVPGFVHDVSATGQTVYVEPRECLELNNDIRELESAEAREIENIRRGLTDEIRVRSELLAANDALLVDFDVALAIARLGRELDGVVPRLNDDGLISIVRGRSPELAIVYREKGRGGDVVPLDVEIGGAFVTLVISGPNAGGKSIAMKTVGLLCVMLGMGIPVPVDETSTFCLFDRLMVDIGDEQSVEDDLSTFSSHLQNQRDMLRRADDGCLVLIDEAGTGTDPDEGSALARSVLERLTGAGARTIATTHHSALKAYAHDAEGVANGSMSFDRETLKPTYEFKLHAPGASYAAEIAEKVGLPPDIIARSRELTGSDRIRMESLIVSLEEANRVLDGRISEAEEMLRSVQTERASLRERLRALQGERDGIIQKALDEAESILQNANRTVERVVREIRESDAESERTKAARAGIERERGRVDTRATRLKRRTEARRKQATTAADASFSETSASPIHEGDFVRITGTEADGQVLSIKGSEAVVRLGDLQSRIPLARLVRTGSAPDQTVTVRHAARSGGGLATASLEQRIDVRGLRVDEALSRVESLVDEALAAGLNRAEILHGKGTGALRQAIREYLSAGGVAVRIEDAPWNEGGAGVTYVWFSE